MPASLELTSLNGGPTVTLPLCEKDTHTFPCISQEDQDKCQQILYLLDRFNVGDKVYHELSMVSKDLPKSYRIKKLHSEFNCGIQLTKTPGNSEGVSSTQQIHKLPDCVGKYIRVKISGDGAKFSRSSNCVLLSFSLLNMGSQVL